MRGPIIIKLGGSAITVKERPLTPRLRVLHQVAYELASFGRKTKLVIVHGGGSFGHPQAARYRIHKGVRTLKQLRGVTETKLAVEKLCLLVSEILMKHGIHAIPIHPSGIAVNKDCKLYAIHMDVVREVLDAGLTPILHGDVVPDLTRKFSILSGDVIASRLAVSLKASILIFGLDVDGIYDRDPKIYPDAKLIAELRAEEAGLVDVASGSRVDVTGGMKLKISEAIYAAKRGIRVLFFNITRPGNLRAILEGRLPGRYTMIL